MKFLLGLLISTIAVSVAAETVSFSNFKHQKIPFKSPSSYSESGSSVTIASDGGVSIFYGAANDATKASWAWSVSKSVPATSIARKGGDDRNIAIYFIYAPTDQAASLKNKKASSLLQNSSVKALVYSFGGSETRGTRFMNPYMNNRGLNIVLRSSGTGTFNENVNLEADFASQFSGDHQLIGVAISSDSDDTKAKVRAKIQKLNLN